MAANKKERPEIQLDMKRIDKNKNENKNEGKKTLQGFKRFVKFTAGFLLILCLIAGGFFLGVYLRVFDVNAVNEKLGLDQYPIIGQYFPKSAEKTDDDNPADKKESLPSTATANSPINAAKPSAPNGVVAPVASKPVVLTKEEVEKQMKLRQAEEKKRISKLARLYGEMKPKDAVAIMDGLSDDIVIEIMGRMDESQVSKILAEFEPGKSANFTRIMYNGKPPTTQVQ